MSLYPCEVCGTVTVGRLDGYYYNLVATGARYRRKIRVCRAHGVELLEQNQAEWSLVSPVYGVQRGFACRRCGVQLEDQRDAAQFYCDIYLGRDEKCTYAATYCVDCGMSIVSNLDLERADPLDRHRGAAAREMSRPAPLSDDHAEKGKGGVRLRGVRGRKNDPHTADDDQDADGGSDE